MPPTAGESDQQPAKPPRRRPRPTSESLARAEELRKEWKEVKVAAAGTPENPLGINVYKLGAKDGRGSWFARRSVHADMSFDKWRLGLEREFAETMKVQTGPGGGSIRGIGAERVVERHVVDEVGRAEGEFWRGGLEGVFWRECFGECVLESIYSGAALLTRLHQSSSFRPSSPARRPPATSSRFSSRPTRRAPAPTASASSSSCPSHACTPSAPLGRASSAASTSRSR
jgi:hypothetical protein